MLERLKVVLRDQGMRADVCEAAFAIDDDDLARGAARARALQAFLATADGADLVAGDRRAGNILEAEGRKGPLPTDPPGVMSGAPAEEVALIESLDAVERPVAQALAANDFGEALTRLATLRAPVDAFFDKVLVNDADGAVRANRLALLVEARSTMRRVADFSRIAGTGESR